MTLGGVIPTDLGYVPKKASEGKYRRIKVLPIDRGLKVRHGGGYLATPQPAVAVSGRGAQYIRERSHPSSYLAFRTQIA